MDCELTQKLAQEFPEQFDPKGTQCWSHVCPGWLEPVRAVMVEVRALGIELKWSQIKEKFGGLRMYASYANKDDYQLVRPLIEAAEDACSNRCFSCGAPAELRQDRGWYRTSCERCASQ